VNECADVSNNRVSPFARRHDTVDNIIASDEDFSRVMQLLESGHLNPLEPGIFDPVFYSDQ